MLKPVSRDFRALNGVAFALILFFVMAIGWIVSALRADAIRDADNDSGNIAVVLGGQIASSIQSVDIILNDVRSLVTARVMQSDDSEKGLETPDLYNSLLTHLGRIPQAHVIAVIDNRGRVANSTTQWPPTRTDVADRDYFQHFKKNADHGLFISTLLLNRLSGEKTIFFSRRITGKYDEFLGLILIGVRLSYFEKIYQAISPLRDQSFLLLHPDGTVLVRYPNATNVAAQKMPPQSPWHSVAGAGGGSYRSPGYFDGSPRYVSVRPLKDYPLVVNVAVEESAALANWYRRATQIGGGSILALFCCALLLRVSIKQFRRVFLSESKLQNLAHYDQLTGLANRVSMQNDLMSALKTGIPTSIAIFDLDGFKDVNDTLGHSVGDHLLVAVAQRLASLKANEGKFYRLGGDEFVYILVDCGDPLTLGELVDAALRRLSEPFNVLDHQIFVGASAGIAIGPAHGVNVEELVSNADLALYDAKAAGGNTYRLFVPVMRAKTIARRRLDVELRRASANNEFELFYQPQVRTIDGSVVGLEALLRWRHPERGILAPGAFIDALSESPVVLEVGRWILHSACVQAADWRAAGLPPLRMGVNLFSAQFHAETLVHDVQTALHNSALPPELLEIEITENIVLGKQDKSLGALRTLRDMGVSIAFDDFGTGYASLSYLALYPLTRLKIDQSFVRGISEKSSAEDTAIVRSIITMSHNLGLEVIAEGVETAAQAAFLKSQSCEELQGYFYAKPMSAVDLELYLQDRRIEASINYRS